ncbi:MAG: SdrD B-like domain-containing protein, partial [Candidatus Promineifilaceae bacterium]
QHADFASIGFCADYNASAPDVADVYEETTASALGFNTTTANNISAALRALSDPNLSSYSLYDRQIGVQGAIWKFTNNRSVSGLSSTVYNRVIDGTYQPQTVKWLENGGQDQPLVIMPSLSDFGDAPASYGDAWATIDDGLYLGSLIDGETGSAYSNNARGDDNADSDDEDGVSFVGGFGTVGSTGNQLNITVFHGLDVPNQNYSAISVWVDFNGDGDFDDNGEQIISDVQVTENASSQTLNLTYDVPANATVGTTYVRVRLDADSGMSPTGLAAGNLGEVEDYRVTISSLVTAPTAPSCPSGALLWENNVDVANLVGSSGVPQADVRFIRNQTTSLTIPGPYPSALSGGSVQFNISEAIAWDGYTARPNTGDQPNERFKVVALKNGSVVYQSAWTGGAADGIDTGVYADEWIGSLGSTTLADGADEIRLVHWNDPTYGDGSGSSSNSVVPTSVCIELSTPQSYTLGDLVFNDINRDGIKDANETGVNGVTVELFDNATCSGSAFRTDTTANGGIYNFGGLGAGDYCVRFSNLPADYVVTSANQGTNDTIDSDGIDTGAGTATIPNITLNGDDLTNDLGIYEEGPYAAIGDYVWYDSDQDGIQDAGEPGLGNVTLALYLDDGDGTCEPNGDDTRVDTTVTNADGSYLFTVAPGNYCVEVTDDNGELIGLTHSLGDQSVTNPSPVVTLNAGDSNLYQDFGYYQPVSNPSNAFIGDTIWYDDGDGIQEPSELGIPGVTVSIKDENGVVIAVAITDENGNYLVQVPAGAYIVTVDASTLPAGLTQSGDPDGTLDGQTPIYVGPGETNLTADFGYTDTGNTFGSIGNQIWIDDGDGTFEPGSEDGIAGVSVKLIRDTNGNGVADLGEAVVATVYTDENGEYLFDSVPAGDYIVCVSDTSNVLRDLNAVVGPNPGADNNAQGGSYPIDLGVGENNTTADFGYMPNGDTNVGVIGNQVWFETDKDGLYEAGELGIAGVTIELRDGSGGFIAKTTTAGSGKYAFTGLPAGNYQVVVTDEYGILDAFEVTTLGATQGADNNNQAQAYAITLPQGGINMTADFGYTDTPKAVIGDYVWYDGDADGIQDAGEPGIGNVTLNLYKDSDGDGICEPGGDDELVDTTVTNADGSYLFTVAPGSYCVDVTDTNDELDGLTHTTGSQSVTDPSPVVTLPAGGSNLDQDFGYYKPVSNPNNALIGDTIWFDDGDGVQEPNEMGIPGVSVEIRDEDGNLITTVITDETGNYLVEVPAGTYTVSVVVSTLPAGLTQSGDPDGTLDNSTVITVGPGETDLTADFGYGETGNTFGSIGNQIWSDDGDGTFETGTENGIPGVSVKLIRDVNGNGVADDGEPVVATTYTDENGEYLFNSLPAGDYVVCVSDTSNVLRDYESVVGPNIGDDNNSQGGSYAVTLTSGETNTTADFGYVSNGNLNIGVIGNQVWFETDKDGLYELGELGLAGVTVELRDGSGGFIAKTTTAGSGKYAFPGLMAGTYQVVVTDEFGILNNFILTELGATPGADNNNQAQAYTIVLPQAGINTTADFGYTSASLSIGNYVWSDDNNNGIQDEAASFAVPNVPVRLYRDSNGNGVLDDNDEVVANTTTDDDGFYRFDNLGADIYFVNIPLEALFGPNSIPELRAGPADQVGTGDTANDNNGAPASNPLLGVTSGPVDLGGNEPAENGTYNDTVDFGFKALDPTSVALRGISAENATPILAGLLSILMLAATAFIVRRRSN